MYQRLLCVSLCLLASAGCATRSAPTRPPSALGGSGPFSALPENTIAYPLASAIGLYRLTAKQWPVSLSDLASVDVSRTLPAPASPPGDDSDVLGGICEFSCLPKDANRAMIVMQTRTPRQTYVFDVEVRESSAGTPIITLRPADEPWVRQQSSIRVEIRLELDLSPSTTPTTSIGR